MLDSLANLFSLSIAFGAVVFFYLKRSRRYLQFFQQEEYNPPRFFDWYKRKKAFDRKGTIVCLFAIISSVFGTACGAWFPFIGTILASIWLVLIGRSEEDPRKSGKITLKMTERAQRIYNLALVLYVTSLCAISLAVINCCSIYAVSHSYSQSQSWPFTHIIFWLAQILLIQSHPAWILLSNALLMPHETKLQAGFAAQAKKLIREHSPTVIGITGSYGKTSTKVILKDILSTVSPTFTTPRSINSYMGVTREIRERLKPQHHFAVIEMGAYYRGSINRMCELTPPKAGIITAVGEMHLERFGSQENVFLAKSELAQAIPEDGILVCNGDSELCREIAKQNQKKITLFYGLDEKAGHLDACMFDIQTSSNGSNFKIRWRNRELQGSTRLLGQPMLSNVLASFTMACALGLDPELVLAAIYNVKAESNRLEPVRTAISALSADRNGKAHTRTGQVLRLNDAYNSNPIGFAAALDVLATVKGERKVLVTPGMVELGAKQQEENRKAATKAASICDLVLVVGETNKAPLLQGLLEGGLSKDKYMEFNSMKAALSYLSQDYCVDGDVVLIENDLPDLYEGQVVF